MSSAADRALNHIVAARMLLESATATPTRRSASQGQRAQRGLHSLTGAAAHLRPCSLGKHCAATPPPPEQQEEACCDPPQTFGEAGGLRFISREEEFEEGEAPPAAAPNDQRPLSGAAARRGALREACSRGERRGPEELALLETAAAPLRSLEKQEASESPRPERPI